MASAMGPGTPVMVRVAMSVLPDDEAAVHAEDSPET